MKLVHQQETEPLASHYGKVFQTSDLGKYLILCVQAEIVIFDYAIADWRMDHLQYLHKNSIRNLSVSADKENTQKLILNVHELESNVLPEATLLDTIWNDATISANFSREVASTRSIKCQLLNSVLSSVAGITVGSTSATGTIIYFNGICMLFTAAHLIIPKMAATIKKNAHNILYQKYEMDCIDSNFAKTVIPLIDENMDIALGTPAAKIFVANCIKGCEKLILFKKWWPDALSYRFDQLKKMHHLELLLAVSPTFVRTIIFMLEITR